MLQWKILFCRGRQGSGIVFQNWKFFGTKLGIVFQNWNFLKQDWTIFLEQNSEPERNRNKILPYQVTTSGCSGNCFVWKIIRDKNRLKRCYWSAAKRRKKILSSCRDCWSPTYCHSTRVDGVNSIRRSRTWCATVRDNLYWWNQLLQNALHRPHLSSFAIATAAAAIIIQWELDWVWWQSNRVILLQWTFWIKMTSTRAKNGWYFDTSKT